MSGCSDPIPVSLAVAWVCSGVVVDFLHTMSFFFRFFRPHNLSKHARVRRIVCTCVGMSFAMCNIGTH